MKISMVTIQNSSNFGAMLQAFALQEYLTGLDHDVEIINYSNPHMGKGLDQIRHGLNPLEMYYSVLDIVNYKSRKRKIANFRTFSSDYLRLGIPQTKEELLTGGYPGRDVFISGSDQIWNPNVTNGMVDEVYYCGMSPAGSRVISYASSMGGYDFKDDEKNRQIAAYLEKYSAISTRESGYIPQLRKLTGLSITKVVDPVFLLSDAEWKKRLGIKDRKEQGKPYVLIYAMSAHEKIADDVRKAYHDGRYDIVMIYEPLHKKRGIKYITDAGPREFVELFYNADIIVTNSFHGTAFGLIFRKNIKVYDNAKNMNRIYDLLSAVKAESVLVRDHARLSEGCEIEYGTVTAELCRLIEESKVYLCNAISDSF